MDGLVLAAAGLALWEGGGASTADGMHASYGAGMSGGTTPVQGWITVPCRLLTYGEEQRQRHTRTHTRDDERCAGT